MVWLRPLCDPAPCDAPLPRGLHSLLLTHRKATGHLAPPHMPRAQPGRAEHRIEYALGSIIEQHLDGVTIAEIGATFTEVVPGIIAKPYDPAARAAVAL